MDIISDEKSLILPNNTDNTMDLEDSKPEETTIIADESEEIDPDSSELKENTETEKASENPTLSQGNTSNTNEEEKIIDNNAPILAAINNLSDRIEQMSKQFDTKIMHTAHEERIVDQMHSELQRYKEDMYAQLVRPILLDIIEVRDSILRLSQVYGDKPMEEQKIPLKTFSDYAFDIQDILEKNNIQIYKSNEGESFTPIKQRVIKKINTSVEGQHGKIAESLSDGYEYMGKTISPEKIAVYVFEATEKKEGEKE